MYCCRRDNTPVSVHCGQGLSCAGTCSAQGATICPTGDCLGTCEIALDQEAPPAPTTTGGVLSPSTKPSEAYRHCYPTCKVKGEQNQHCCFHPQCLKKRPGLCSWVNDLTGNVKLDYFSKIFSGLSSSIQIFGTHSIIHSPLSLREINRAMCTHLVITAVSAQLVKSAIQHPLKFPLKKMSWSLGKIYMSVSPL